MSAYIFKITINNETNYPREVAETSVYNQLSEAHGEWESGNDTWRFTSQRKTIGSSGALRIKPTTGYYSDIVIAVGYWYKNDKFWVGIAPDLQSYDSASSVLPKFYGNGQYDKEGVYWSQEFYFTTTSTRNLEEISIIVVPDRDAEVLNTTVNIRPKHFPS